MDTLNDLPAWSWIVAGLVLMGAEMLLPGVYLLWIGLAAIATGLIASLLTGLPVTGELAAFAMLALASLLLARYVAARQPEDKSHLNDLTAQLIGRELVLSDAIIEGVGRARDGDGSWRVLGPDLPAHARVRVVAVEGGSLRVTAAG